MHSITEMTEKFKKRVENDPKMQDFIIKTKARLDTEQKMKLEAREKFDAFLKDKFKISMNKGSLLNLLNDKIKSNNEIKIEKK